MKVVALAIALVLGVAVPVLCMRALVPSLGSSENALATNFRGRRVFYGLGVVWLIWGGCAMLGGVATAAIADSSTLQLLTVAGALAMVAFALGLFDDAYGTSAARGFRGHIGALTHGRLTTGGLKLFGISLASLAAALVIGRVAPWGGTASSAGYSQLIWGWGAALVAGASIALTSNLLNLTDLRPGRALKSYLLFGLAGIVSTVFLLGARSDLFDPSSSGRLFDLVALSLFVLGPVIAVWRYDLGEQGMLGDAGANPMGAVAGLLIVAGLPLWALCAYFVGIFGLNLASERVSFSKVIAASTVLSRVDGWGRLPDAREAVSSAKSSTPSNTKPE